MSGLITEIAFAVLVFINAQMAPMIMVLCFLILTPPLIFTNEKTVKNKFRRLEVRNYKSV